MKMLIGTFSVLFLLLPLFFITVWLYSEFMEKAKIVRIGSGIVAIAVTALFYAGYTGKYDDGDAALCFNTLKQVSYAIEDDDIDGARVVLSRLGFTSDGFTLENK